MCSTTSRRPRHASLVLAICLVALCFHFVGESLGPEAGPAGSPAAAAARSPHPGHDLAEDQFVLSELCGLAVESGARWAAPPRLVSAGLARLAPPAPPPNL